MPNSQSSLRGSLIASGLMLGLLSFYLWLERGGWFGKVGSMKAGLIATVLMLGLAVAVGGVIDAAFDVRRRRTSAGGDQ